MASLTKKQRIVLWLLHQGKSLRQRDGRTFFTYKEHIAINMQTMDKLLDLGLLDRDGGLETCDYKLSTQGIDAVKRMRPFQGEVTYGGKWAAKPFRGCDYCGRDKSHKSIRKFDCVTCDQAHRACPPCRNKHIRVKGDFPRYQVRLNACPPKKAEEASAAVPAEPQKA